MKTALKMIEDERKRQIEREGWTAEHDDQHTDGSLAMAAALYASPVDKLRLVKKCKDCGSEETKDPWPWWDRIDPPRGGPLVTVHAWDKRKKHDRIRRLQIAGALIVAEIERLQRLKKEN
jgi:hypothetical protein